MGKGEKVKKLILTLAALLVIGGGTGVIIANQNDPQPTTTVQEVKKSEFSYQGVEGKDALTLLKESHTVVTTNYEGVGEMVAVIDGVKPNENQFWGFYVNGEMAQVGASSYITKDADKIVWKLVEIE